MRKIAIHHDPNWLLGLSKDTLAVQAYKKDAFKKQDISIAGSPLLNAIRRLGVFVSPVAMDFLSIATGVIAADTFIKRAEAADRWTRMIDLTVALYDPKRWTPVQEQLECALRFLSGDIWRLNFVHGGHQPPAPMAKRGRAKLIDCDGLDCVSLFSGGLDSAIGAIDLLQANRKPLLVSHSYRGDKKAQGATARFLNGKFSRFSTSIYPRWGGEPTVTDVSMRTRSISFLALAIIGADAVSKKNSINKVDIIIPENGFISLNIPLTPRRIGSFSTRTTHPYFISCMQNIFDSVGINVQMINPYQFKTKGEMVNECLDGATLKKAIGYTVSCGKWKRKNAPCGRCLPCLIRRASLYEGKVNDGDFYPKLKNVLLDENYRDDLISVASAILRYKKNPRRTNILLNGQLPYDLLNEFRGVFHRGIIEIENFLISENIAC